MPEHRRKRLLLLVLPQGLLLPSGLLLGLVWGVVGSSGAWAQALANASHGPRSLGPAHAGSGLLLVLGAALAVLGVAIASSITLAGLGSALMGAMYGFVMSCLIDWLLLWRRPLATRDIESIKRWAGRGALATSALCAWLALFSPLRDVAGVFAVTGTFVCLGFGAVGLARFTWARLK